MFTTLYSGGDKREVSNNRFQIETPASEQGTIYTEGQHRGRTSEMPTGTPDPLLRFIRAIRTKSAIQRASDGELLERFIASRDEGAFAALVHRHGPMVLGVCRRILRDAHYAEDVFQVTFLLLAQQAHAIRRKGSVGSWLYGVAFRMALKGKRRRDRVWA